MNQSPGYEQPPPGYGQPPPGYDQPPPPGYGEPPAMVGGYNACCCKKNCGPPKAACSTAIMDIVFSVMGFFFWISLIFGLKIDKTNEIINLRNAVYETAGVETQANPVSPILTMIVLTLLCDFALVVLSSLVLATLKNNGVLGFFAPLFWIGVGAVRILFWIILLIFWGRKTSVSRRADGTISGTTPGGLDVIWQNLDVFGPLRGGGRGRGGPGGPGGPDGPGGPGGSLDDIEESANAVGISSLRYTLVALLVIFMAIYLWFLAIMYGYFLFKKVNRVRPDAMAAPFDPNLDQQNDEASPSAAPSYMASQ